MIAATVSPYLLAPLRSLPMAVLQIREAKYQESIVAARVRLEANPFILATAESDFCCPPYGDHYHHD